jgi:DNA-directed RNA polymerase subunit M/transcription elongation factor TFIIS
MRGQNNNGGNVEDLVMADEAGKVTLQNRNVKCPKCGAQLAFRRSTRARYDELGFVRCKLCCDKCLTFMIGIIDPFDGTLHVGTEVS